MLIQACSDGMCRIFLKNSMLCAFYIIPPSKREVDKRLKLLRIKRREKWRDYPHGSFSEAKLRFITPIKSSR